MFRRAGGRGRGGSNVTAATLMGLYQDGQWYCNCTPRQPASNFKVKKAGRNQGRWFYTCSKPKGQKQCNFFLWEDDAKPREEPAGPSDSRTEPRPANEPTTPRAGGIRTPPPPPYTAVAESSRTSNNQANVATDSEEEDLFPWPLTGEEEAQIVRQADAISPPPTTPRKLTTTHGLVTPSTTSRKRNVSFVDGVEYPELPTSNTTRKLGRKLGGETPQSGASLRTIAGPSGFHTPQTTPTPSRFKDTISDVESGFDFTADVLDVLKRHKVHLDDDTQGSLEELLNRSSLRVQGIVKGRDVSRLQIKAKDARITEQQLRISTLEAELEAERAVVEQLKWERRNGTD